MLANPGAVPSASLCQPSQVPALGAPANGCPAASQVGTGTVTANATGNGVSGAQTLPLAIYLMPAQSTAELARAAVVVSMGGTTVYTTQTPATLNPAGQVTLTLSNLPSSLTVVGVPMTLQVTATSVKINGTVDGNPFTFAPAQCVVTTTSARGDHERWQLGDGFVELHADGLPAESGAADDGHGWSAW